MSRKVALPAGGTTGQALTKQSNGDYDLYWETPGAGPGGSGDVVGPASATDGAVVLYDGTTGKLIKNSTILPTTVGIAISNLANPSAVRFIRINADNTVTARTAAEMLSDIGAQASGTYLTSANIVGTITNGVTTNAPSEDAVFDALALKGDMFLATAQTSTGKKTFQSDATNAGINLGAGGADPSSLTTGDQWVDAANSIKERNNGTTSWAMSVTSAPATNRIPYATNTNLYQQDANFNYNGTTLNAPQFNGVPLTAAGVSTKYLNEAGTYTTPAGGSGLSQQQVEGLI